MSAIKEYYNNNEDFKAYVDSYAVTKFGNANEESVDKALEHKVVEEVYKYRTSN